MNTLHALALTFVLAAAVPAAAQTVIEAPAGAPPAAAPGTTGSLPPPRSGMQSPSQTFSSNELVTTGHQFFGSTTRGLASAIETATKRWGEPNGYVLGEEGSGAVIGGLRYGEGTLYTRDHGDKRVYWQGPTLGFDFGGDGARTMMLVYNLPGPAALNQRFAGVDGSVYVVGGFGVTALTASGIVLVPIRSGVGARLGLNVGYLKFTPKPTWNPF
jgi:hypothetical protein